MVKLRKLRLQNFQSWKDETIELSDGLNAIIGVGDSNNTGKSVIFKALKVTCNPEYFTRAERNKLIRYGNDFARAYYSFSDGSIAIVTLTHAKVMYNCEFNGVTVNTEGVPPHQLIEKLSAIIETESKYLVNVMDPEQAMLFVKSDKKANSSLMKVVTEHPELNRLMDIFKDKVSEYTSHHIKVGARAKRLEEQMNSLQVSDIPKIEDELYMLEMCEKAIDLAEFICDFTRGFANMDRGNYDWKLISSTLTQLEHIDNLVVSNSKPWASINDLLSMEIPEVKDKLPWDTVHFLLDTEIPEVSDDLPWNLIIKVLSIDIPKPSIDYPKVSSVFQLCKLTDDIETELNSYDLLSEKIAEINAIDFNGTKYSCPIHGTIMYRDGKCIYDE